MKIFIVKAEMNTILKLEIQADSEDQAYEIAKNTCGSEFTEIKGSGTWEINHVVEKRDGITTRPYCKYCGGTSINLETIVEWSDNLERPIVVEYCDKDHYCSDCNSPCKLEWF